ncbi:MAG TPA: hypothetical protein VEY07_09230 [Thermoplasmata archaeon]|nr:hypothetical protein [Thermoplasmata archaeon]
MAATESPESVGVRRLATGAATGLAGAILGVVIPLAFLYLSVYRPQGYFELNATLVRTLSLLLLAGSVLLLLSLFLYRRSFAHLRKVDRRFAVASALCLVGTLGFLLLLVAALLLLGSSDSLIGCVQGRPTQTLRCLQSGQPLGAYTAIAGFLLGWLGGLGIVIGLFVAGSRYRRGALTGAAVLYGLLLLVIVGPFVGALYTIPGAAYLLLAVPLLLILAPGLAYAGAGPVAERVTASSG